MTDDDTQIKVIAKALYEIRILLSSYLGSANSGDLPVREAAHLAYALHNDALAIIEGRGFDTQAAIVRIKAIKRILPTSEIASRVLGPE